MFSSAGFAAYNQLSIAFCAQPPPVISRSNFSLANLDSSPRQSRVFAVDFQPSPTADFNFQQSPLFNQSPTNNYADQSFSNGVRSKLMNSNDSLNTDHTQQHGQMPSRGDPYRISGQQQQMIDQQQKNEIARTSGAVNFSHSTVLSSPAVSRREFGPPPTGAYISSVPPPQHGRMLVDPQTGQQYFVATNAPPPQPHAQVAYYPVYYGAAPPPPAPVYYAQPPPPQWISGPMPSPPAVSNQSAGFFTSYPHHPHHQPQQQQQHYTPPSTSHHHHQQQHSYAPSNYSASSMAPYHVEMPPSSSVSLCGGGPDERNSPTSMLYFQRHHESRMSTESAASAGTGAHYASLQLHNNPHSDDSMSPVPVSSARMPTASAVQRTISSSSHPTAISQSSALMEQSARYSTASSNTSGFISGAGETDAPPPPVRPNALPNLRPAVNRPKLYGAPEWWGEESSPEVETKKRVGDQDRTPTHQAKDPQQKPQDSPTSQKNTADEKQDSPDQQRAPIAKAVRMDIDLSRPLSPENKKNTEQKPSNRAPATAFTVNFDSDNDAAAGKVSARRPAKPPTLSSSAQEQNRRGAAVRRSVPPTRASQLPNQQQHPSSGNQQQDPKRYLFSKMIQGFGARSSVADEEDGDESDDQHTTILSLSSSHSAADRRHHHDMDAISEAGTYVIDEKKKFRRHHDDHRNRSDDGTSSSSASSTVSTATNPSSAVRPQRRAGSASQPNSARSTAAATTITSARSSTGGGADSSGSARPSTASTASPHFAMRRSLMKDLRDLRAQNPKPVAATASTATSSTSQQQPKARSIVDQSKASRLSAVGSGAAPRPCQQQPATNSRLATATSASSSTFRRSDGGRFSMRSAAGGTCTTSSSRPSVGSKPPFRAGIAPSKNAPPVATGTPEMANWLRRKGYDPRKSVAESRKMQQLKERSDTFFANRSVSYNQPYYSGFRKLLKPIDDERSQISLSNDDLSRLQEENFSLSGSNSNLTKTVDELTQKCQRSMQLLKLCNPNALSESVEHLLDQIVDDNASSDDGDNAIDRLQRLNEAFGALQKCLEENTTTSSRTSSPRSLSTVIKQQILSPVSSTPPLSMNRTQRDSSPEEF